MLVSTRQCLPWRQPPPTTQHPTWGPSSKGQSGRKAPVSLSAAPATSRRGQRLLRNLTAALPVRAALPIVKKPRCLQTLLLDSSEFQTLHLHLVGVFDNGHKCPGSKMCRHKHLLAQHLRTQVRDLSKPYTCRTRTGRVTFRGAKPQSRWVEKARLCEQVRSACRDRAWPRVSSFVADFLWGP